MRTGIFALALASSALGRPFERRQAASSVAAPSAPSAPSVSAPLPSASANATLPTPSANATAPSAPAALPPTANSTASASSAAPSASANATSQFIAAVRARNAYQFADLLQANQDIVNSLAPLIGAGQSPLTIILPADEALAGVNTANKTLLAALITNHVIPGNVSAASIPPVGVYPNALTNYRGHQQYVVLNRNSTTGTTQLGGIDNGTILANSTFQNVLFKLSLGLVNLPQNASATLAQQPNVSTLYSLLGGIPQVTQQVDNAQNITIFAPINSALASLASQASSLNAQTIQQVIQNHVLQQTLYSPNISAQTQAQNANGSPVTFSSNQTGTYVTSGGASARIVTPNLQLYNGVVHLINGVLFAQNSTSANSTAASGPSASAISPSSTAASSSAVASSSAASSLSSVSSGASSVVASSTAAPTTSA